MSAVLHYAAYILFWLGAAELTLLYLFSIAVNLGTSNRMQVRPYVAAVAAAFFLGAAVAHYIAGY